MLLIQTMIWLQLISHLKEILKVQNFVHRVPLSLLEEFCSVPKEDLITYHPILFTFKTNKNEHGFMTCHVPISIFQL